LSAVQKRSGKIGAIEHRFEEVRAIQVGTSAPAAEGEMPKRSKGTAS
jgi:hypothetical protein